MPKSPATALSRFDAALSAFCAQLPRAEAEALGVYPEAQDWLDLLRYKLAPFAAGEDCLVVALCGGTNTGKSTLFNALLGRDTSPVRATAAATCRPVLAVAAPRGAEALKGALTPGFEMAPLDRPDAAMDNTTPEASLFVATVADWPENIALLDTPDVDSIEQGNWNLANHLRASCDALIAVVTAEKYKDQRVVDFFRRAVAAGRLVAPVMNKADAQREYEVARAQLREFVADIGLPEGAPCFVAPYDPALQPDFSGMRDRIMNPDTGQTLMAYLESVDTAALKKKVYRESTLRFAEGAGEYLETLENTAQEMRQVAEEFENRARQFAEQYDPAPGAAVGGLFHEFVQQKRGPVGRVLGAGSEYAVRGITAVGGAITRSINPAWRSKKAHKMTEDAVNTAHREMLTRITNELAASYTETAHNLRPGISGLVRAGLDNSGASVTEQVVRVTLKHDDVSEDFREHANRQLEDWWENHATRRKALIYMDYLLMVSPVAIAGVMTLQTGGLGVSETMIATSPLMGKFAALVAEYQFGDALFGLLKPWREEQRANFLGALQEHLAAPVLDELNGMLAVLDGEAVEQMRREHEACLQALQTY